MSHDITGNWRIDVHHHVVPPQYADDSLPIKPPDIEAQLRSMDHWRIQAAVTSLTPRVILRNKHRLREVARICNEFQAKMLLEHPSRFGSFALLPLPDVDGALEEITYALDILHLDGVGLFSSIDNRYLGDPLFDPVFEELDRRQAIAFIHPSHCEAPAETNLRAPPFVVEYVFDTTRALVNLIYTGALKRFPDIRFIVAHGGGTVPFLAQRISMMEGHRGASNVRGVLPALRALFTRSPAPPPRSPCVRYKSLPIRLIFYGARIFRSCLGRGCRRKSIIGNTTTASMLTSARPSSNETRCKSFRASHQSERIELQR